MALAQSVILGIDANRTVKDELTAALKRQGRRRRISVTDLVNLRQAFFQRARPDIQPDPERKQAMLAGTGFHEVFGRAVSTEEFVEQFVEFQGIVGKIDIYDDVPVELKTTASLPQGAAPAPSRDSMCASRTSQPSSGRWCGAATCSGRRWRAKIPPACRAASGSSCGATTARCAAAPRPSRWAGWCPPPPSTSPRTPSS